MIDRFLIKPLTLAVNVLAITAGVALMFMMIITCLDILLRAFGSPITGTLDIVRICAAITIAGALPYTTASKGHVAIEFISSQFPDLIEKGLEIVAHILGIILFVVISWQSIVYGIRLEKIGQVSNTLQIPLFWLPWIISLACIVTALVILFDLIFPNKKLFVDN